jgi:hypothetical protein
MLSGNDVVQAGHVRKKTDILKGARHPQSGDPVGGKPMDRPALEQQAAGIRPCKAAYHVYQSGFARAVGPYKSVDRSSLDTKRDP